MLELFHGQDKETLYLVECSDVNKQNPGKHEVLLERLYSLEPHSIPPGQLKVKLGYLLIIVQNLSIWYGHCNST
jgi:hypothetical protein